MYLWQIIAVSTASQKLSKKNQFNIYMDTNTVSLLLVNYYKNIKDAEAKYSI